MAGALGGKGVERMDIVDSRLEKIEHLLHGNGDVGICETMRETRKDVARISEQLATAWKLAVGILVAIASQIIMGLLKVI